MMRTFPGASAMLAPCEGWAMLAPCEGFPAAVAAAAPRTGGELPTVSYLSLVSDCKRTFRGQAINLAPMGAGAVFRAATSMQHSPAQAL
jgi:hypothetical protein